MNMAYLPGREEVERQLRERSGPWWDAISAFVREYGPTITEAAMEMAHTYGHGIADWSRPLWRMKRRGLRLRRALERKRMQDGLPPLPSAPKAAPQRARSISADASIACADGSFVFVPLGRVRLLEQDDLDEW